MKKILFIVCVALTIAAHSQTFDASEVEFNNSGKISTAKFQTAENKPKAANATLFLQQYVANSNSAISFKLSSSQTDDIGLTHSRYQQYYQGVKVYGAEYLVHISNGEIMTINGNYIESNISNTLPNLTEAQALAFVLSNLNAVSYKWQIPAEEAFIKQAKNDENATYYPKGELAIATNFITNGLDKLVYVFDISVENPNDELKVFVDANTGTILKKVTRICNMNPVAGNAQTIYSGTKQILCDQQSSSRFVLQETTNANTPIYTQNANNGGNSSGATDFVNTSSQWINGNWNKFSSDQVALDAHLGAEKVADYWKNVHNRLSINNNNLPMYSFVHTYSNYDNAYWDGTAMFYGDGDYYFKPLASLDVCGHEMGHGICDYTANLVYWGEPGGLNEGFSDIWGACIEKNGDPSSSTKNTWLIGEEITKVTPMYLRSMKEPKTGMFYPSPDCYGSATWNNMLTSYYDPHYSSGVLNKWFYILTEGETKTNDLGNAYSVTGIGITDAAKIAYRTELIYLISSSDYAAARIGSIQAARDLYGIGSCQEIAVTNAWYAVGVGTAWKYATLTPNITTVCNNTPVTLTFNNVPVGIKPTWTVTPATGIVTYPSTTGNSITLTQIGNGTIKVDGDLGSYCKANIGGFTKTMTMSKIPSSNLSTSTIIKYNTTPFGIVKVNSPDATSKYTWTVDGIQSSSIGWSVMFPMWTCGKNLLFHDFNVNVIAKNVCGISQSCGVFRQYCQPLPVLKYYADCNNIYCIPTKKNPFPPCMLLPQAKQDINRFKLFQDPENISSIVVATKDYSADEFSKLFFDADALQNEQVQTIVVLNADGEPVLKLGGIAQKITTIDMSSLPEGNYNIQVYGNGEYSEQQTFKYSLGKSDVELAEDVVNNNVEMSVADAADRIEVMKQQLYKELRTNEELLANSDILKQFFASQKVDDIGRINEINELLAHYDIPNAEGLLLGWQPTSRQSLNCLQYYTYFISYLGGYTFTQQDIDALFVLANSCPDVDGEIVFAARSLYNYVTQLEQDFSTACNGTAARSIKKVKSTAKAIVPKLVLYPNPSKGNFSIMFPSGYKGVNTVKVLDQTGKVLLQKTVISGVQNFSLNQSLANGVYTVQTTNSVTGKTENQKLIISK